MSPVATSVHGNGRIVGLDTLRFVCAIWVALHHGARPDIAAWFGLSALASDWNAIAFDGVAAVIVFFMISGLCVHYPYAKSQPCNLPAYFVQRFVRIGIPLVVVAVFVKGVGPFIGDDIATAPRMVLWSLWCELIYYALYPILLVAFRRIGLLPVIVAAFVLSYWAYPRIWAAAAALPAWVLGCAIAQFVAAGRLPVLPGSVWWWRLALLVLSIPPKALLYPSVSPVLIPNPATLNVLALFVFPWLVKEIAGFQAKAPPAVLEWGGRWSYSLYLVHYVVIVAAMRLAGRMDPILLWCFGVVAILLASYLFYCVVERPAHLLARSFGRRLARQPEATGSVILPAPAGKP